ncbi:MAG: cellulase family glycosylhydrolase [Verrucomicrobiota bacterium]
MRTKFCFTIGFCWAVFSVCCAEKPLGLTQGPNGTVLLEGKPYRGVGINFFDCFYRTLQSTTNTSYEEGFRVLATNRIPFVRFAGTGFWPRNMQLYQTNRAEYFRRFDGVVRAAERHNIGLIPSLFWFHACVPDLVGEPIDQWGNPNSKTHAFMRQYTHEVVSRYRTSPAIWAWEMGNEFNSDTDLPNALEYLPAHNRPAVSPRDGTPASRTARDYPTHTDLGVAFREFGKAVRQDDPHRLIESGSDFPRTNAWHFYKEHKFGIGDNPEQREFMLGLCAPDPMDLISVHCYNDLLGKSGQRRNAMERLDAIVADSRKLGKPLFVGEFQFPSDFAPDSPEARTHFTAFLAKLDRLQVPLAAVWVFDLSAQESSRNVTATNRRAWQLKLLRDHNEKLARTSNP